MSKKRLDYALRGIWKKKYEDQLGQTWNSSIHRDASQLNKVIEDIGYDRSKELIEYYFEVQRRPDFMYFIYNYDKIAEAKDARDKGIEQSKRLREATRRRMKELDIEGRVEGN